MNNSNFGSINWNEFLNGLIMAVYGGVIGFAYETLIAKGDITWENVLYAALVAGVGYLSKKFTTNSAGGILKTESGKFLGIGKQK